MIPDCKHCPFGMKEFDALICPNCYDADEPDFGTAFVRELDLQNMPRPKQGDK